LLLIFIDRRMRLKVDPFRRDERPWLILGFTIIVGLGHLLLDFTNDYGIRPLLPFSHRWFYGDLIFIADPWIWLILGGAAAWVTLRTAERKQRFGPTLVFWLLAGAGASAVMALVLKSGSEYNPPIPHAVRIVWFCGLAIVAFGIMMRWGNNGTRTARWAVFVLAAYYSVMLLGRQTAILEARAHPPSGGVASLAAWPEPANPVLWDAVGRSAGFVANKEVNLIPSWLDPASKDDWRQMDSLDERFRDALDRTDAGHTFLGFARFPRASVEDLSNGYRVTVSDSRFSLRLRAELDTGFNVRWASVSWF
ncbi:MAG: metal-dependent hydrolase, partial [Blastocatellia bacterium]